MTDMKTVSYEEFAKARDEVTQAMRAFEESEGTELAGVIEIIYHIDFKTKEITTGINWASYGTVDTKEAMELTKLIKKACEFADSFRYNGYTVTF